MSEAEESLVVDRPTEPAASSPDDTPAPAAIPPACPACEKSNHPGVARCVFCGEPLATTSGMAKTARAGWVEGPESGQPRIDSEPPPSRRPSLLSEADLGQAPVVDPLIGVVVADRYRIVDPLGRGGMGVVYKVEHTRIGKLLAMKLLTGELSRNPEVVRRFKHEALTASKLSSPNTVQVFDFGVSDGLTYLVMELVAGEDLGRALRTLGPLSFARLGRIIVQVCSSLAEAHQKGIVHRDIKPENVMLVRARDGSDIAKVLDFGLAKLREGSDLNDVTSQGAIVGTPYFMAPEQVRGEAVDARTDIYAVGGLMYRALTGHYPFNGPTPMAVFTKHLTETAIPPHIRAPELGIPAGVSRIVMKALAKNAADRYQRVDELKDALVEEIRELGESGVDALLDSGAVRKLAKSAGHRTELAVTGVAQVPAEIATRDEVEAYERKLRRTRYGAYGALVALLFIGSAVATRVALQPRAFSGVELEPNDGPAQATSIPLGQPVSAYLGKRIDPSTSDRDFFAFEVPRAAAVVRLTTTALPNIPMCTLLYRQGLTTPIAQYCVGRPGRDLEIGALRLEPGKYLATVLEDRDPYGAPAAPFVYENVSDPYRFEVDAVAGDARRELEPNDQVASANAIAPGSKKIGVLGWAHDEDVYCIDGDAPNVRFRVTDAVRPAGAVLEVTPLRGGEEGAPVRVHASGKGTTSATDGMSPWEGPPLAADGARCLRVRVVTDPWIAGATLVPSGGPEAYTIEVLAP